MCRCFFLGSSEVRLRRRALTPYLEALSLTRLSHFSSYYRSFLLRSERGTHTSIPTKRLLELNQMAHSSLRQNPPTSTQVYLPSTHPIQWTLLPRALFIFPLFQKPQIFSQSALPTSKSQRSCRFLGGLSWPLYCAQGPVLLSFLELCLLPATALTAHITKSFCAAHQRITY